MSLYSTKCTASVKKTGNLTEEDRTYNERGQRFLAVMKRLRDCTWTREDYYWLCTLKLAQRTLAEKASFAQAPTIMEFRKERENDSANDSCEAYNRHQLYLLAKETNVPVARITAYHETTDKHTHKELAALSEENFNGLPNEIDLCEGAPILYTHNLWVDAGLMNGTRGIIRAIVYRYGDRPDHVDPRCRLPHVILVECPTYEGPPFFNTTAFPDRHKWVPFFP